MLRKRFLTPYSRWILDIPYAPFLYATSAESMQAPFYATFSSRPRVNRGWKLPSFRTGSCRPCKYFLPFLCWFFVYFTSAFYFCFQRQKWYINQLLDKHRPIRLYDSSYGRKYVGAQRQRQVHFWPPPVLPSRDSVRLQQVPVVAVNIDIVSSESESLSLARPLAGISAASDESDASFYCCCLIRQLLQPQLPAYPAQQQTY